MKPKLISAMRLRGLDASRPRRQVIFLDKPFGNFKTNLKTHLLMYFFMFFHPNIIEPIYFDGEGPRSKHQIQSAKFSIYRIAHCYNIMFK